MAETARHLPDDLDERLWIRTSGWHGRGFLGGSSHTFRGRMVAYCPHHGRDFSVSKYEVTEASTEASLWIEGFLRGNEPGPPEETKASTSGERSAKSCIAPETGLDPTR